MGRVSFRYLSQEDVIKCGGLDMKTTLRDVEKCTVMMHKGEAIEATTATLFWDVPDERKNLKTGYLGTKRVNIHGAYLASDLKIVGIKNIPSNPENPIKYKMPRASGLITLISSETGYPIALMDAMVISGMRTGALAGVGAKYLAPKGPYAIGQIGTGPINQTALMAMKEALEKIDVVNVFDLKKEKAIAYQERMKKQLGLNIRVLPSAEAVVKESNVVIPATTILNFDQAYIEYSWLQKGCLLADLSVWDEKLEVFQKSDKLVVNSLESLKRRNLIPGALVAENGFKEEQFIDLGPIIEGKIVGRESNDQIIVYMARGMAIYDVISAYRINKRAEEAGIGKILDLWQEPAWF